MYLYFINLTYFVVAHMAENTQPLRSFWYIFQCYAKLWTVLLNYLKCMYAMLWSLQMLQDSHSYMVKITLSWEGLQKQILLNCTKVPFEYLQPHVESHILCECLIATVAMKKVSTQCVLF